MKKHFCIFAGCIVLIIAMMACSFSVSSGNPPPSQNDVSTVVALTMQALTPVSAGATNTPESANTLLPRSLYYLNSTGSTIQIFRMERDGKTVHQVTSESVDVGSYDVSPVDGRVAYVVNNQLVVISPDGSVRTVLVDGGAVDQNNPVANSLGSPVWSPDGRTLAYAYHGLNFYSLDTGSSSLAIENKFSDVSGMKIAVELYSPHSYSPDGKKLLTNIGFYEGGTMAIYHPDTKTLVRLSTAEGGQPCCDAVWTPDSAGLYSASPYVGMISSGLWHINAADGKVTTLLPSQAADGTYNFADAPILGPDGQLYFFFSNLKEIPNGHTPLQLVRSGLDGVTDRTVLKETNFQMMNEALWSPDASFVIEADAPVQEVFQGGVPAIIYIDGRPEVQLAEYAQSMKWGP